jgi:hypothetical protein
MLAKILRNQSEKLLINFQWRMTSHVPDSSGRKPGSSVVRFVAEFIEHTPIDFYSIDLGADDFA